MHTDDDFSCCHCRPTAFLEELRGAYAKMTCGSPSPAASRELDNGGKDEGKGEDNESKDNDDNDEYIQKLLEELDYAEYSLDDASKKLDDSHLQRERDRLHSELLASDNGSIGLEDLEATIQEGIEMKRANVNGRNITIDFPIRLVGCRMNWKRGIRV